MLERDIEQSKQQRAGGDHYRAYVGPPKQYDFMGATQFRLVTALGLREEHRYLDVGCGSLRAGRLLIPYLMPGRYYGIEPNTRLYKDAIAGELGQGLIDIKQPVFFDDASLDLRVTGETFDFIVAQSIFSHTGLDMLEGALSSARDVLAPSGQFLFTAITESAPGFGERSPLGRDAKGWIYPECVSFSEDEITSICNRAGLQAQRLAWFHPRQVWYRAVTNPDMLLNCQHAKIMDAGRVLFDDRFQTQAGPKNDTQPKRAYTFFNLRHLREHLAKNKTKRIRKE